MKPSSGELLAGSCLLLALLGAAVGPAEASRLHLHTPKIRRLEGKATLLTLDTPNTRQPQKLLKVQTDLGEKVLVLGDAAKAIAKQEGFVSGARVSLEGVFISRGAGAVRPVSGAAIAKAQYCFVGNDIAKTAPSAAEARAATAGPPTVTLGATLPVTGAPPPAVRQAAAAAALGRPGGPAAAAAAAQAAEAEALQPRDEAGLPIASAAWVGLGPAGNELPAAARRALLQSATPPKIKISNNTLVVDKMTTIIVPISANESTGAICPGTSPPRGCPNVPCTAAQLKRVLLSSSAFGGNPSGDTVGRGFEKCSFGKTKFDAYTNIVEVVNIPCSGITNGVAWTFTKCDFDDFNGYADKANEVLAARGINVADYRYAVYLLPPSLGCFWVGLGYVGCDGSFGCRVWISGDFWTTPQGLMHELQHNLYLGHATGLNAAGQLDEYFDSTCSMGHCCESRCPNVAHGWQMGWYGLQAIDGSDLKPGTTLKVTLAPGAVKAAGTVQQGVRLNITWSKTIKEPIFIGYRNRTANTADATLQPDFSQRVHIYTSNIQNTYDPQFTTYKTALGYKAGCTNATNPPCVWETDDVVIRVTAATSTQAIVTICRKVVGGKETRATCLARVDADCNGKVNTTDTNCLKLVPKRAEVAAIRRADAGSGIPAAAAAASSAAAVPPGGAAAAAAGVPAGGAPAGGRSAPSDPAGAQGGAAAPGAGAAAAAAAAAVAPVHDLRADPQQQQGAAPQTKPAGEVPGPAGVPGAP